MKTMSHSTIIYLVVAFVISGFVSGQDNTPSPTLKLDWSFQDKGESYSFRVKGRKIQEVHKEVNYFASNASSVYLGGTKGNVYCLSTKTGEVLWNTQVKGKSCRGHLYGDQLIVLCGSRFIPNKSEKKISEFALLSSKTGNIDHVVQNTHKYLMKHSSLTMQLLAKARKRIVLPEDYMKFRSDYRTYLNDLEKRRQKIKDPIDWEEELLNAFFSLEFALDDVGDNPSFKIHHIYSAIDKKANALTEDASDHWIVKYSSKGKIIWKKPMDYFAHLAAETEDKLFLNSQQGIVCMDKENGDSLWEHANIKADNRHGAGAFKVVCFRDYVAVLAKNLERPDHPFRTGNAQELNLLLLSQETGEEVMFHRFNGITGRIILAEDNVFAIHEQKGTLYCYSFSE